MKFYFSDVAVSNPLVNSHLELRSKNIEGGFRAFGPFYIVYGSRGYWSNNGYGFIGFRFNNGAGVQYGWARIRMTDTPPDGRFFGENSFMLLD